jgi:hypothetical protein
MNKYTFYVLILIVSIGLIWCGKNDDIVGSSTDTIEDMETISPFLLADGVSTVMVVATVYDSSGKPAQDLPVYFQTTAGSIIETSNSVYDGKAYSILTSSASATDFLVTITATVLDSTYGLPKAAAGINKVEVAFKGFKKYPNQQFDLKKCMGSGDNTASIQLMFLGISFNAELEAATLPADGISTAKAKVTIKETTSKKAVTGRDVSLAAAHGTITNKIRTNEQGIAETNLTAHNSATIDTVYFEFGNLFLTKLLISYETPKMNLTPESAYLIADGSSQASFVLTVKSQKNTPIIGAEIKFSTTAGTISPSSIQTNSQGQAQASLISTSEVKSNVMIIAKLNSFADTSIVNFINPTFTLNPTEAELTADGLSTLKFTAKLTLPDNTPISNAVIMFTTNDGTINPVRGSTNAEGTFSSTLTSSTKNNNNVVVSALFQNLTVNSEVKFVAPILTITPDLAKLPANGVSKQAFTATLTTPDGSPIPGANVDFFATNGTITQVNATTNSSGNAFTELRSSTRVDSNVLVIANFYGHKDTAKVNYVDANVESGLRLDGETQIYRDGVSAIVLTATFVDENNVPVSDAILFFESTYGQIQSTATTNSSGKASITYTPDIGEEDILDEIKVTVSVGSASTSLSIHLLGITMQMSATPNAIPADGTSTSSIEVLLKLSSSQTAIQGKNIVFSSNLGFIGSSAMTNSEGVAKIALRSSSQEGTAVVSAVYGGFTRTTSVIFESPKLTLSPEVSYLIADGVDQEYFTASLKTQSNTPIIGAQINFSTSNGTISPSSDITNSQGVVNATLTSTTQVDNDVIVIASLNTFSDTSFVSFIQPNLELTPMTAELAADGNDETTFTASLLLPDNTPVVGAFINFSTSAGTISPTSGLTNSAGKVQVTLRSSTVPDDNVLVTATFQNLTKTAAVKFIAPILSLTPATGELSADGTSQMTFSASLLLPDNTPVTGAQISFTTSAGAITPSIGLTNSEGKIQTTLKSGYEANSNVIITATFQDLSQTSTVSFVSPILTLSPSEAKLVANGVSKQAFTATLISSIGVPIPNVEIQFMTTNGTILNSAASTNAEGKAYTELKSSKTPDENVLVVAKFYDVSDTAKVDFVESSSETGLLLSGDTQLFRDGISSTQVTATVLDDNNVPVPDATVFFSSLYGQIPSNAVTNGEGKATVTYTPDTDPASVVEEITATVGSSVATHSIQLLGLTMTITASPDSIPADGSSESQIIVQLKLTESQMAVPNITISFSANIGYIATAAATNAQGVATIFLQAAIDPGISTVTAQYGGFIKTTQVEFYQNSPQSMLLSASPNYIWVKETGNLEQTLITATVLGVQGEPIGHEVPIKFYLQNGPGGGAGFVVAGGDPISESESIMTVNGGASIGFRSGTRSGTVEIRAELVDQPSVLAQTTNLVVRSGPPYIWIDPADPSNVVSHMTLTLDYFNLPGWSHLTDYNVSFLIGDKYNNPVELGTTVYFTTTGGVITTDDKTDARGMGGVILASGEPKPYVCPQDPLFNPHTIENPNSPAEYLPITLQDFEFGEVTNSCGATDENDGISIISAYTHGRDQNGDEAKVWSTTRVVFGGPTSHYDVYVDPPVDTLNLGEIANIHIRVWDINGNPPAAGSSLKAKSSAGSLSGEDLMPSKENYGFGSTYFNTILLNNLDPVDDEPTMAEVTVELSTPFGKISGAVYIYLKIN